MDPNVSVVRDPMNDSGLSDDFQHPRIEAAVILLKRSQNVEGNVNLDLIADCPVNFGSRFGRVRRCGGDRFWRRNRNGNRVLSSENGQVIGKVVSADGCATGNAFQVDFSAVADSVNVRNVAAGPLKKLSFHNFED